MKTKSLQKQLNRLNRAGVSDPAAAVGAILQLRDQVLASMPRLDDGDMLMMKERVANQKFMQHRAQALKARDGRFSISVRRIGDIDCATRKVRLHESVPIEGDLGRSALQDLVVSNWHPMKVVVSGDDAVEVVNADDAMLQQMEQAYPGLGVADFILGVGQQLQDFNPSGGCSVEIPWNSGLDRELTPSEVTAIAMQGKGKK